MPRSKYVIASLSVTRNAQRRCRERLPCKAAGGDEAASVDVFDARSPAQSGASPVTSGVLSRLRCAAAASAPPMCLERAHLDVVAVRDCTACPTGPHTPCRASDTSETTISSTAALWTRSSWRTECARKTSSSTPSRAPAACQSSVGCCGVLVGKPSLGSQTIQGCALQPVRAPRRAAARRAAARRPARARRAAWRVAAPPLPALPPSPNSLAPRGVRRALRRAAERCTAAVHEAFAPAVRERARSEARQGTTGRLRERRARSERT